MGKIIRRTFSIPDDLKKKMDKMPHVNWVEVVKQGILKKAHKIAELEAKGEL